MKRGRMSMDRRIGVKTHKTSEAGGRLPAVKESVTGAKTPSLPPPPPPPSKPPSTQLTHPPQPPPPPPPPSKPPSNPSTQPTHPLPPPPPPPSESPSNPSTQLTHPLPPPPPRTRKSNEKGDGSREADEYLEVPDKIRAAKPELPEPRWISNDEQRKKLEEKPLPSLPPPPGRSLPPPLPVEAISGPPPTDLIQKEESLAKLQRNVDETRTLMQNLIGVALDRGKKLDELVVRSESLGMKPHTYSKAGGVREESIHDAALQRYNDMVLDHEGWLRQACEDIEDKPSVTYSMPYLIEQMRKSQKQKTEITVRLAQLKDIEVECERLCKQETPARSYDLRASVTCLREDTEQLQLKADSKQELLQEALKESERQREELNKQLRSEQHLKKRAENTDMSAELLKNIRQEIRESERQREKMNSQLRSTLHLQKRADDTKSVADSSGRMLPSILGDTVAWARPLESSLWSDDSEDSTDSWSDSKPEPCEGIAGQAVAKTATKNPLHNYVHSVGHEKDPNLAACPTSFIDDIVPDQVEPANQTQVSLSLQISPDGASYHFPEENMSVIIPPNSLHHSEDPCTISIIPEEPKADLTPDAESKIYEFLPSGLTTRNRMMFVIPLMPAHSYDYDNLTLMYRQDRDSEFVPADTMKDHKPAWVFCGSVCYTFLSHFCGVYIKKKHLFSKTPVSVTLESLLFYKYNSPVLELKTTFGCYSAESACSTQKVKQHYIESGYEIAEQRRILLKKGCSLTVEPKYCRLDWKPKFTGDGKEVRDDTVFMNMCHQCSTRVGQWPENFSHQFYQLEELSDDKQDVTVWLDQQPHLKTFLSQNVSQLATESIHARPCIRPRMNWSDIDSDGKIKEIFCTQMSKQDMVDCARVMAVQLNESELSVREFTEIFLHEFMSRYHGPKDKVSVLCALIVLIGHFSCLENIRSKLQNVIQIGRERPSEQHQQTQQQRGVDADTDDVNFRHPVLQKHKDDLLEHLNPNFELVEKLMDKDILSPRQQLKISQDMQKGDLRKEDFVKPILHHVRDVDSEGLVRFTEGLRNCDPTGTNAALGRIIHRSYEEWINSNK